MYSYRFIEVNDLRKRSQGSRASKKPVFNLVRMRETLSPMVVVSPPFCSGKPGIPVDNLGMQVYVVCLSRFL